MSALECSLDGADFGPCTSPVAYPGLAEGAHAFAVRATDAAGNTTPTPTAYAWVVDTTAPDTIIDSGPAALTASNSPTFAFHASEGSTFECSLDGGAYAGCASPAGYSGLADGPHTFAVRARDAAGNEDPSPGTFAWTIDSTPPPAPVITAAPANPTNQTSATFGFADDEAGVSFVCQLDAGPPAPCASPASYPGPLAQGSHTFSVLAQDAAGNRSAPAVFTWTVDTTPPPKPTITSAPPGATAQTGATFTFTDTKQTKATFKFTDSEAGVSFLCQLDGAGYSVCSGQQQ